MIENAQCGGQWVRVEMGVEVERGKEKSNERSERGAR